ncbi:MAG: hypothetical protein WAN14_21015 [Candidatus Acidiferrales bacterium]
MTIAAHGIVFAPGKAGALQEIFQDAVHNYHRARTDPFSPMVLYDKTYWTRTLPAAPLLEELFTRNNRGPDYKKCVLVRSWKRSTSSSPTRGEFPSPAPETPRLAVLTLHSVCVSESTSLLGRCFSGL